MVEVSFRTVNLIDGPNAGNIGFVFHIFKRGSGHPGRTLTTVVEPNAADYPAVLRECASRLEEELKGAESW